MPRTAAINPARLFAEVDAEHRHPHLPHGWLRF
jgi:hypothetical protein